MGIFLKNFLRVPIRSPDSEKFFEVTVGGKHCVVLQPDRRGAEKGCIPHKARFPEHLFGLDRVP